MPVEWNLDRQRLRARARRRMGLWAIASACMVAMALYCIAFAHHKARPPTEDCPKHFAGDSDKLAGSCWCGAADAYCMCTPSLAIDTVIEVPDEKTGQVDSVLVIRRRDNNKLACIGGFVEVGETLEEAVRREVMEETTLLVTSLQMIPGVYDDPGRDARRHTVSVAYVVRASGEARPGQDEKEVVAIPVDKIQERLEEFAFDHSKIMTDYLLMGMASSTAEDRGVIVPATAPPRVLTKG